MAKTTEELKEYYRQQAYLKTEEGKKRLVRWLAEKQIDVLNKKVLEIDDSIKMEFKDEEAKKIWYILKDAYRYTRYGKSTLNYARRWAKYMQYLIAEGATVAAIADTSSREADTDGITGFMYVCALNHLVSCWKYGEELRIWHNKKYNYEGEGVVNAFIVEEWLKQFG